MKTLRRTLHPQTRVLDEKQGLVEYVASNERLDSYNEIIRADGWRFDDFQKNSPFVDSHNYSSIDCLLGKVIDFKVSGKRLVETVKWAIDVPENLLAQKGFAMTAAGYLKAVSVGFTPIGTVTPYDHDREDWLANCEELGIDPKTTDCRCIYVEQQQKELSACVIGANPDALANVEKALRAGVLNDSDIQKFSRMNPGFGREFEKRTHRPRSYSFSSHGQDDAVKKMTAALGIRPEEVQPPAATNVSDENFLSDLNEKGLRAISPRSFEGIEIARRRGNQAEIERAVHVSFASDARARRHAFGDPVENYLSADPERRFFWNGLLRAFVGKMKMDTPEYRAVKKAVSGINVQDTFGTGLLLAVPVADELFDLVLDTGQFKYLGHRKMVGAYTKFAEVTALPTAVFITPTMQGNTTIPDDAAYSGVQVTPDANTIACIIKASVAWVADEKVDFSNVIVEKITRAVAARIDYGAFQGNGNNDTTNGMTTGIFENPNVKVFVLPAAENAVSTLQRADFINTIGLVNVAALQRMDRQPPRWYIAPAFIPQLLLLKDGVGPQYLLKTPAETQGEWHLCGFPVTWASQAPTAVAPGSNIAAFGNPDAYIVALQERFDFTRADKGAEFADVSIRFRAIARGQSMMRDASGFALMQLAG